MLRADAEMSASPTDHAAAPAGRRVPENVAHERRRDVDPELAQLTDDPKIAPAAVLARQPQDQLATSPSIGGRPGRQCGYVQWRATSRRCQHKSVSGLTTNAPHKRRGNTRLSAVNSSRSSGVNRGRFTCRRRIDSSRRNTKISSSFERSPRPTSTTNSIRRQESAYTNETTEKTSDRREPEATPPASRESPRHSHAKTTSFCAPRATRCVYPTTGGRAD